MYCSKCGTRIEDGAVFCSGCGQKTDNSADVQTTGDRQIVSDTQNNIPNMKEMQGLPGNYNIPGNNAAPNTQNPYPPYPNYISYGAPVYTVTPKKSNNTVFIIIAVVLILFMIIGSLAAVLAPSMLNYAYKSRLKEANSNAKTAYNVVSEYLDEYETQGGDALFFVELYSGNYEVEDLEDVPFLEVIYNALEDNEEMGEVYIGIDYNENVWFIQWRSESGSPVGQYPSAVSWESWQTDNVEWGEYWGEYDYY